MLASVTASPNLPQVTITFPNGGETVSGTTITWTAGDADQDNLTYTVQYSSNGGASWQTLVVDWPGTSYTVPDGILAGSTQAMIRIIVSDGFHTTQDTSDAPFTVLNHAPNTFLESPADGTEFIGVQQVHLNGSAFDAEDGFMTGASLTWSSDLNGTLGTGTSLVLSAVSLNEGQHIITLKATDSQGLSASQSVRIRVHRVSPVKPPVPSVGGPYETSEGTPITLDASGSTDPDNNIVLYEWDLDGDGLFDDASTVTAQVTYPDNGTFPISVRVTDAVGDSAITTGNVAVSNVSPSVTPATGLSARPGELVSLTLGTFTDPGTGDVHTATIDWGDDSGDQQANVIQAAGSGVVTGSHTYSAADIYDVKVCVTDDDTGTGCATTKVDARHVVQGRVIMNGTPIAYTGAIVTFSTGSLASRVVSSAQDGRFEVRLLTDTYNVTIENDGFLRMTISSLLVDADITLADVYLLWGDFNQDGVIDIADLVRLSRNFGES